jgi:hypothetical protein
LIFYKAAVWYNAWIKFPEHRTLFFIPSISNMENFPWCKTVYSIQYAPNWYAGIRGDNNKTMFGLSHIGNIVSYIVCKVGLTHSTDRHYTIQGFLNTVVKFCGKPEKFKHFSGPNFRLKHTYIFYKLFSCDWIRSIFYFKILFHIVHFKNGFRPGAL